MPPNLPPVADAGPDQSVECADPGGTPVTLDGSGSSNPDGDPLTFTWTGPFPEGGGTVSGVSPVVTLPLGLSTITLEVDDGNGETDSDDVKITVEDTTPPTITLLGDNPLVLECAVDTYTEPGATVSDACDESPSLVIDASAVDVTTPGSYPVTYTAEDASGNTTVETRTVEVVDTIAPTITLAAGPIELWPPNHKYHTIGLGDIVTAASDLCDLTVDADDVLTTAATSDEPEEAVGDGDGNTLDDIVIASDCRSVDLRAERQGGSNGRVYELGLGVIDASGNVGTAAFQVHVRHDEENEAVDDGQILPGVAGCTPVVARASTPEAAASAEVLEVSSRVAAGEPEGLQEAVPDAYVLEPAYPNPFNPQTRIRFGVPEAAEVSLIVFDVLGREVARLVEGSLAKGMHEVIFNAQNLPSGLYVYRLTTPTTGLTRTMLLLK